MIGKKMLIIDDHKEFRETLRSFIGKKFKDILIKEAATGEEGVKVATTEKPDICLIDIRLPGIDGIETARQIRQDVPGCMIITMSMFKQSSWDSLINKNAITFVNKEAIDSEMVPLLHKILDGQKQEIEKNV